MRFAFKGPTKSVRLSECFKGFDHGPTYPGSDLTGVHCSFETLQYRKAF